MDSLNSIPIGPSNGNKVYFVTVTRNIQGVPTQVLVATETEADMPVYVATIPASAVGASKNHASVVNKTGSGKIVRVLHVYAVPSLSAVIAGVNVTIEIHGVAATGPTAGTVITPRNYDTDDGDLPAQIEVRSNPTATPAANWILASGIVNTEEATSQPSQSDIFTKKGSALILRENQGLLFKQTAFAGVGNFNLHIVFQVD